jgi:DNA-binding MarR family transcriptional regulator
MDTDRENQNQHILQIINEIYKLLGPAVPEEWLSSDLTVTQLRLVLVLQNTGPLRMSDIASSLQVTLPTTTIIVDNLVRKNLVLREASPQDRRLVICKLAPQGELLLSKLWGSGQMVMRRLLDNLNDEERQKAAEVAEMLYQAALKMARANQ